ncbi:ribonuclease domain-containing protein [Streptomyces sp. ST2-7A]|uniref:ribonuclease domain-containing protein n=1 Tax=Streptomyces sp. ST2-7A TaxID=2907214 RepID=UPI001F20CFA7|nr:ribonuclease domain-containing protein [Streptomyces sp. ST2-7A]MCE7083533.1 ribonuclease N [Streptomyces sp. ST2-7A]
MLALLLAFLTGCGPNTTGSGATGSDRNAAAPTVGVPAGAPSGMGTVDVADLPAEAHRTIELIDAGGPFPYDKDGSRFGNYEKRLPIHPDRAHYREYTVDTPGLNHRGARRIVTGGSGEMYYTDDHYETFRMVIR